MSEELPVLICTVGLPRSGKTSWAQEQGSPIVNPDSIRLAIHGQRFISDAEPYVWAVAKTMVRALFLAGHSKVILDATNITQKRRDEWLDDRWSTQYHIIDTPVLECIARATGEGDMSIIPVIERMAASYEPLADDRCSNFEQL